MISKKAYNKIVKARRKAEFLAKLDKGLDDIKNGKGITISIADLEKLAQ